MREDLLPGVTTEVAPPSVVCDAKGAIRSARRRALFRDVLQVGLLVAVDYLFVHWPESRVPFLDRHGSFTLLLLMNAAIVGHLWLARAMPRWTARRIATTWSRAERERFTPAKQPIR